MAIQQTTSLHGRLLVHGLGVFFAKIAIKTLNKVGVVHLRVF